MTTRDRLNLTENSRLFSFLLEKLDEGNTEQLHLERMFHRGKKRLAPDAGVLLPLVWKKTSVIARKGARSSWEGLEGPRSGVTRMGHPPFGAGHLQAAGPSFHSLDIQPGGGAFAVPGQRLP